MIASSYNCSQQDLYNACRIGWQMCQNKLSDFGSMKAKYKPAFIEQNLADIETADRLSDNAARNAVAQGMRLDLIDLKDQIVKQYGWLKAYIDDAFPLAKRDIMYNAAGEGYLAKAKGRSWGSVTALLSSAIPFIEDNKTVLAANENMPPKFVEDFKALELAFKTAYTAWLTADKATVELTDAKVTANNTLYNNLQAMLTDGQRLFRDDATIAKQFSFTHILAQTHGIKNARLTGKVTQWESGLPVMGAVISLKDTDKAIVTDEEGRFDMMPLAAGIYTVLVKADACETQTFTDIVIKTGVTTRLMPQVKPVVAHTLVLEPA